MTNNLQSLKGGLKVAYDKPIDFNDITDEFIDGIFDVRLGVSDISESFIDSKITQKIDNYSNIIKDILRNSSKSERREIITNIDTENFISNLRFIYETYQESLKKEDILELVKENPILIKDDLKHIISNYKYLRKQQLIAGEDLDKIYIGNSIQNIESKIKTILLEKDIISKRLELLAVTPSEKHRKELVDNLTFTIRVNGIRDFDDIDRKTNSYFNHNLYENMTRYDNERVIKDATFLTSSEYKDYFNGIRGMIFETLNKMNSNLVDDLNLLAQYPEYKEFINSLDTIKNWNKYNDNLKRANDLKDEFISRIIFGTLERASLEYIEYDIESKVKVDTLLSKIEKGDPEIGYDKIHIDRRMLDRITGDKIDVFFDIRRRRSRLEGRIVNKLGNKIVEVYPPAEKTIHLPPRRNQKSDNIDKILFNQIENNLLNQLPPISKRKQIVEDTYHLINNYNKPNSNKKSILQKLYKTINYYLIVNNEYEIQNFNQINSYNNDNKSGDLEDVRILAKKVYNTKSNLSEMDRIFYNLYNSNRLAHSVENIGQYRGVSDNFVMNPYKGELKNKKETDFKKYNYLQKFGIDTDFINESIENYISNSQLSIYNIIDKNNDGEILNYLKNVVNKKYSNIENKTITMEDISSIKDAFKKIKNNDTNNLEKEKINKQLRDEMYISTKESSLLFTTKKFLIDEVVNKVENNSKKKLEDMDKLDKLKINTKYNYVVEYEMDGNDNLLLVVNDNKFNSPFSVHVMGNNLNIDRKKLDSEQLIRHNKNHGGLIQNKSKENFLLCDELSTLKSGFNGEATEKEEAQTKLFNLININLNPISNILTNSDSIFNKAKELISSRRVFSLDKGKSNDTDKSLSEIVNKNVDNGLQAMIDDMMSKDDITKEKNNQMSLFGETYKFIRNGQEMIFTEQELGQDRINKINNNDNDSNRHKL